jgi:hypothetical protein
VPRGAAELAVGGRTEADALLHRDGVADRCVLDGAQLVGVDLTAREALAGSQQGRRAQQAPDVIGPEGRSGAGGRGGSGSSHRMRDPI